MLEIASLKEITLIKENERQKVFLVEDPDGKKYIKRVLSDDKREVYKVLEKIKHENIPNIYYVGFDSDTIVLEEYVAGIPLSDFMEQGKKLNQKQVRNISKQILSAMEVLHKVDIIHKDIKPDNILIDDSNHVWLTDYDIARIYRKEIRKDTETMGTFGYAPIEQFGMLPTDFKTDIYAFGVTLSILLEYINTKVFLVKVAEKCKKVDPSERYQNAKEVERAITWNALKYPLVFIISVIVLVVFLIGIFQSQKGIKVNPEDDNSKQIETEVSQPEVTDELGPTADSEIKKEPDTKMPVETPKSTPSVEEVDFEGTFSGFEDGSNEALYRNHSYYSQVCIFSMQSPWEHLIFIDDVNKTGKLKLGENDTVVDADITLTDGILDVKLRDDFGHTFHQQFQFQGQYEYTKHYTEDLRKNADIICYDFNGDGDTELLVGLSEGAMGALGKQFYNNVNYCIAWCIQYDENKGFTLCDGDMFSKGYSFSVNDAIKKLNVSWEDIGDVTGYLMEGDKIIPN